MVSTRSKSGTTWLQAVCLVLVFQTPELPGSLADLSPWLDWTVQPRDQVVAQLAAQAQRRVIKTHTPLDGLPLDDRATFLVAGRHPLDMAVSLYHQGANIDRVRLAQLTGAPADPSPARPRPPLRDWLLGWIDWDGDPLAPGNLDTLPGVLWHLSDAWARRHAANVVLVHYEELRARPRCRHAPAGGPFGHRRGPGALARPGGGHHVRPHAPSGRPLRPRHHGRGARCRCVLPARGLGRRGARRWAPRARLATSSG